MPQRAPQSGPAHAAELGVVVEQLTAVYAGLLAPAAVQACAERCHAALVRAQVDGCCFGTALAIATREALEAELDARGRTHPVAV